MPASITAVEEQKSKQSYDEVLYPSHSYRKTRPDYLATIAYLFGLEAPDFNKARVLELGCAAGGNLIPMAQAFPEGTFVGIDISGVNIREGDKIVKDLGLKNIKLHEKSILDIKKSFGKFDYIIVHGIYSWVPEEVQKKILSICKENLSPKGVAYISYNTLPGWNAIRTIRDMMLFHSSNFSTSKERILEARRMLQFVLENTARKQSSYEKILHEEAELLSKAEDNYLFHDHLEGVNSPCYFHEFMQEAAKNDLQYLAECDLQTMYLGNHAKKAQETLAQLNDIVRQEQYMDFLNNRRFRSTLLCHAKVKLSRHVSMERLEKLCYYSSAVPEKGIEDIDFTKNEDIRFNNAGGTREFTTHDRMTAAFLCAFVGRPVQYLSMKDIAEYMAKKLKDKTPKEILQSIRTNIGKMLFLGLIEPSLGAGGHKTTVTKRPKAWPCTQYLARSKMVVPNVLHNTLKLDTSIRILLQYVDGKRSREEITEAYLAHFLKGELVCNENNQPVKDEERLRKLVKQGVDNALQYLANNAVLVA